MLTLEQARQLQSKRSKACLCKFCGFVLLAVVVWCALFFFTAYSTVAVALFGVLLCVGIRLSRLPAFLQRKVFVGKVVDSNINKPCTQECYVLLNLRNSGDCLHSYNIVNMFNINTEFFISQSNHNILCDVTLNYFFFFHIAGSFLLEQCICIENQCNFTITKDSCTTDKLALLNIFAQ